MGIIEYFTKRKWVNADVNIFLIFRETFYKIVRKIFCETLWISMGCRGVKIHVGKVSPLSRPPIPSPSPDASSRRGSKEARASGASECPVSRGVLPQSPARPLAIASSPQQEGQQGGPSERSERVPRVAYWCPRFVSRWPLLPSMLYETWTKVGYTMSWSNGKRWAM